MHERFVLEEWAARIPESILFHSLDVQGITGPFDACKLIRLREAVADQYDWGIGVPTDVFVMALGEPTDRSVTKLGGIPHMKRTSPWPQSRPGSPLLFIGQINFSDSLDIVGELPGEILLIFAESRHCDPDSIQLFWSRPGNEELIRPEDVPPQPDSFTPCYGHVFRTASYPKAKELFEGDPTFRGKPIHSSFFLPTLHATQIGTAPFIANEWDNDPEITHLCTLASASPHLREPYPYVNQENPIQGPNELGKGPSTFLTNDLGTIHILRNRKNEFYVELQSF